MKLILLFCFCVCSLFYGYSQSIYHKDNLTILADSLTETGEYKKAISIRKQAIKNQKKASKDYKAYLEAKYYHVKSCDYEFDSYSYYNPDKIITKKAREHYLDSALQAAIKARDIAAKMIHPDRLFQYKIQSRVYHQIAYLGNWKQALEQAELGYEFLNDTLSSSEKSFVDLVYDIGYIYAQLGDYSKSVEKYQISLDLYRDIFGENNHDVALSYNNIAVQYRKLGLRKKELESLLKAKVIWEKLNEEEVQTFLYTCYDNLFYWYSYYGDFDKAEEYILKRNKLRILSENRNTNVFFRNKEEVYKDKLAEWFNLMLHYSRKKDTIKTIFYADNIVKTIHPDKHTFNFETSRLSATLKFYASILEKDHPKEALLMIDKAIKIQQNYQEIFYTKPSEYQLYKVELLLKAENYSEARLLLNELNNLDQIKEISNRFKLAILNGKAAQALKEYNLAKRYFDDAFLLLNESESTIEKIEIDDLKPLISFEIIEGFIAMGDFYLQLHKEKPSIDNFKKATKRYFLASKIYNQLYLGERYNERLFSKNNDINSRLMVVGSIQPKDERLWAEIINTIENNGSKLAWSRFVFNNQREEIAVSEVFISQEEDIKAQLNFYQNALIKVDKGSEEKIALWKGKIYELKADLIKIQDSIKQENAIYYQLNVKNFDVLELQKSLKEGELILKYILTDGYLDVFSITNSKIELLSRIDKTKALDNLKLCLNDLKQRNPNYKVSFYEMQKMLFSNINLKAFKKLIIIPDGALNYLPFEALLWDNKMPSVSYSSSLLLYQEQTSEVSKFEKLHIGAFSASNSLAKLPKASHEINSILKIFDGESYINALKNDFLKNANSHNVLHLAMHSNIDDANPEFSSLNFYGEIDNKLFISELYNEHLKADMAVLSACDTGNGFYENGEGVISLSRAFNYAGVPSTVMSLWKVDDEATAKIMNYFYEHLKKGEAKDEALKNAKLDYLKYTDDELLKHPYYWSGFVLSGNTDALVEKQNYWIYLAILPLIIIIFFRKKLVQFIKK